VLYTKEARKKYLESVILDDLLAAMSRWASYDKSQREEDTQREHRIISILIAGAAMLGGLAVFALMY
jgi:hypothetical protein